MANPHRNRTTHLIRPSDQSKAYAAKERLRPFRQWVRLTNADTYVCGPFEFAIINGRKSRDRISEDNWNFLNKYNHMFANEIPSLQLPAYSVHCSRFHISIEDESISHRVAVNLTEPVTLDQV